MSTETSAAELRTALVQLTALRLDLTEAGLAAEETAMVELADDIAETRAVYGLVALTEIAGLRGHLHGVLHG
jgi:hypothetical protein